MRRVGPHSFIEVYFAGCNPSFVETSDGYVMIDSSALGATVKITGVSPAGSPSS
jgi:hypothetical protein